eukprot:11861070-Karenia_brevis.AAC.1
MLADVLQAILPTGLEIHAGKSKVMCNQFGRQSGTQSSVNVEGHKFEVLPAHEGTLYLGRLLSCRQFHDTEIEHRVKRAWA